MASATAKQVTPRSRGCVGRISYSRMALSRYSGFGASRRLPLLMGSSHGIGAERRWLLTQVSSDPAELPKGETTVPSS